MARNKQDIRSSTSDQYVSTASNKNEISQRLYVNVVLGGSLGHKEMYSMNASSSSWSGFGGNPAMGGHGFSKFRPYYAMSSHDLALRATMPNDRFDSRGSSETSSGCENCPERRTLLARHVIRRRRSSHALKHESHLVAGDTPMSLLASSGVAANEKDESLSAGGMTVQLQDADLWRSFCSVGTEMIVNRAGRRMFPCVSVSIRGMQAAAIYRVALEIIPVDDQRYRFNDSWMALGRSGNAVGNKVCEHPDSPCTGDKWMTQDVAFSMTRLSNNCDNDTNNVVLKSMQKNMAQVVITTREGATKNWRHFRFPLRLTTFIAVTAYQSGKIRQLKIEMDPYAMMFRDVSEARTSWPDVTTATMQKTTYGQVTDNVNSAKQPRVCCPVDSSAPGDHNQQQRRMSLDQMMYRVANPNAAMSFFNERLQYQAWQQQLQQQQQQLHLQTQHHQQQQQQRQQQQKQLQQLQQQLQQELLQQHQLQQQYVQQQQQQLLRYAVESEQMACYYSQWGMPFQYLSYPQQMWAPPGPLPNDVFPGYSNSSSDSSNNISSSNCSSHTTSIISSSNSGDDSKNGRKNSDRPGTVKHSDIGSMTKKTSDASAAPATQQKTDERNQPLTVMSSLPSWNDGYTMAAGSATDKSSIETSQATSGSTDRDVVSWSDSATRIHAAKRIRERTNDWINLAHQSKQTVTGRLPKDAKKSRLTTDSL